MIASAKNHRRWYQFSLRTVLIATTLIAVGTGWWVHRSREWIRQRHEALATLPIAAVAPESGATVEAPAGLWIFGEAGVGRIQWLVEDESGMPKIDQLFPEGKILHHSLHYQIQDNLISVIDADANVTRTGEKQSKSDP